MKLLSWSGGIDSTANVLDMFKTGTEFETVYVKLPNNESMQKRELRARKKILKALTKQYGDYHVKDTMVEYVGTLTPSGGFVQPYVWATSISYNIDLNLYSDLVLGYIRSDDFWHIKHDFEMMIAVSNRMLVFNGDEFRTKITYPYEWYEKADVIRRYDDDKKILKLTSYCESHEIKKGRCGECEKCAEVDDAYARIKSNK